MMEPVNGSCLEPGVDRGPSGRAWVEQVAAKLCHNALIGRGHARLSVRTERGAVFSGD